MNLPPGLPISLPDTISPTLGMLPSALLELEALPHVLNVALLAAQDTGCGAALVLNPSLRTTVWALGPDVPTAISANRITRYDVTDGWHAFNLRLERETRLFGTC